MPNSLKRVLSLILVILMMTGMVPINVLASNEDIETISISESGQGEEPVESVGEESVESAGEKSVEPAEEESVEPAEEESEEPVEEESLESAGEESVESAGEKSIESAGEEPVEYVGEALVESVEEQAVITSGALENLLSTVNDATVIASGDFGADGSNLGWILTEDGVLTISGTGEMDTWASVMVVPWYEYRDSIKSVKIGEGVTNVGQRGFASFRALTQVTLPSSVKTIGVGAFYGASALATIDLGNVTTIGNQAFMSNTSLINVNLSSITSIGEQAFALCTGLTSVALDSAVTIGKRAFYGDAKLNAVGSLKKAESIGDSVFQQTALAGVLDLSSAKTIGSSAFNGLSGITEVTFGGNLTTIGTTAFKGCGLSSVTIPGSVKTLGTQCFRGNVQLTEATLAEGITEIGIGVFRDCTALETVSLPSTVTKIGDGLLTNDTTMKSVNFNGTRETWGNGIAVGTDNEWKDTIVVCIDDAKVIASGDFGADGSNLSWVLTEDGVLTISGTGEMDTWASVMVVPWYEYRDSIKSVKIGEGVTNVGQRGFASFRALTQVTLPSSVKTIGVGAFYGASALATIDLGNVTTIGNQAFMSNTSLINVNLSSITSIGEQAFALCTGLTSVALDSAVTIGKRAFYGDAKLNAVGSLKKAESIGDSVFQQTALAGVLDLSSAKTIGSSAFNGLSGITEVTFGGNLTTIGTTAFKGCGLSSVTIPGSVKTLGTQCFRGNVQLTEATLAEGITEIGIGVFRDCTALETVSLPSTVTKIGNGLFTNDTAMKSVNFNGTRETWGNGITVGTDNEWKDTIVVCIDDGERVAVTGIELDQTEVSVSVGNAPIILTATVSPENATDKTVIWTSSDKSVATVENGVVTAVAAGTATITAKAGNYTATCAVTVTTAETGEADLSGFTFTARNNYNVESYQVSSPVKQEDGSYIVDIPQQAVTKGSFVLTIAAPDTLEEEFSVTYTSYYAGDSVSSGARDNAYKYAHPATATSTDGVIALKDYYAVYWTPADGLYYSEFLFKIGGSEAKVVLRPCNSISISTITVYDSLNGINGKYPVTKTDENAFTVLASKGTELTFGASTQIMLMKSNVLYVDGENTTGSYTFTVGDSDRTFELRLVDDNYGIYECTAYLTVKAVDMAMPALLYEGEITTGAAHSISTEQYEKLTIALETQGTDENTVYTWYEPGVTLTYLEGNGPTLSVDTSTPGTTTISCRATNTIDGLEYTSGIANFYITVLPVKYDTPTIATQPVGGEYVRGNTADAIKVEVKGNESLRYRSFVFQWYSNTVAKTSGGVAVGGPKTVLTLNQNLRYENSFTPPTDTVGDLWYYCEIREFGTNAAGETVYSDPAVTEPVLIRVTATAISLEGSGTAEDPYLIGSYDELKHLHDLVNDGTAFNNTYFLMTADIALASDWTPMGITVDGTNKVSDADNLHAFSGIFDGGGHTLTVATGGYPLLGYIQSATVKNLNIYGEQINGYGLVNNLYGVRAAGTGITVDNVTLKSGSSTLKAGLLGGEVDGKINPYASASANFMSAIRNCTIEAGVTVGYDGSQDNIGSIAGRYAGVIENCVSYATVKGVNNVGGIVGYKDGSGAGDKFTVSNCQFHGTVIASGSGAGGIVGSGYYDITAPNSGGANIRSCTVDGTVSGTKNVGGILGAEPGIDQLWDVSYIQSNQFNGKVSGSENVGAIIGYLRSMNKFNLIEGNSFRADCGADSTIGSVHMVDTSAVAEGWHDGTYYYDSSAKHTDAQWDEIFDVMWSGMEKSGRWKPSLSMNFQRNHNRNDDPLGVNGTEPEDPSEAKVTNFTVTGTCKTGYTVGDAMDLTGLVFTVTWDNGTTTNPSLADVTVSGFDSSEEGGGTIILKYGGFSSTVSYTVKPMDYDKDPGKDTEDAAKAKNVTDLIDSIDKTVTKNSKDAIEKARAAYDKLTAEQRALVTNYEKLTDAEKALARLTATEGGKEKEYSDQIDKQGTSTTNSEKDSKAARTVYDKPTGQQKLSAGNSKVLEKAEVKQAAPKATSEPTAAPKATPESTVAPKATPDSTAAPEAAPEPTTVPEDPEKEAALTANADEDEKKGLSVWWIIPLAGIAGIVVFLLARKRKEAAK